MSEDKSLEDILAEFEAGKPPLTAALEGMDTEQLMKVADAWNEVYLKRAPVKFGEMSAGEFAAELKKHGI